MAAPETSFRPLAHPDLDAVVNLVVRCDALVADWGPEGWEMPADHPRQERRTWEEDLADEATWAEVACDPRGTTVGVVVALPRCTFTDEVDTGHLMSLFVEPGLHGRGLGGLLLRRAEEWMRGRGWATARVNVLEGAPAVGFYLAHGWSLDGRRGRYERFGLDTVGLSKRL